MREKIVFAPGLKKHETLRSMALAGVNTIGMKIMSAPELARLALMRSGVAVTETVVGREDETALTAAAVMNVKYFERSSYADIGNISAAVCKLRNLADVPDEEKYICEKLPEGIFTEKNRALANVFVKYVSSLKENGFTDRLSLVRKAAEQAKKMDADIICLEEFPLSPLEKMLVEKLSGGSYRTVSITELYHAEKKVPETVTVKKCYGASNEVEYIIDSIYRGKSPDQCTVAVTDYSQYSQLFFDNVIEYNIPVTFGCGIPVSNSNPAVLLKLYNTWMTDGFFGAESLTKMLSDGSFDRSAMMAEFPEDTDVKWSRLVEILGKLRMSNDKNANAKKIAGFRTAVAEEGKILGSRYEDVIKEKEELIPFLEIAARELALPVEEFIAKYSNIRKGGNTFADTLVMKLDMSAVASLCSEIKTVRAAGQTVSDVINDLLKMNVCRQSSSKGCVHLTDINGAFSVMRNNLYIAGMSASNYPGSPTEDYLLLDDDFRLFGESAEKYTSVECIKRKIRIFRSLITFAASMNCEIGISYPGISVSELKRANASSVIYDLFRKMYGDGITWDEMNHKIETVEYFEPEVSLTREIGKAYNNGKMIDPDRPSAPVSSEKADPAYLLERTYSPSALEMFFKCPAKFMFRYVYGMDEPDETKNFDVISPIDKGILAHEMMEILADSPDISSEDFMQISGQLFDSFIGQNAVILADSVDDVRTDFIEMMENAYASDPHNKVIFSEEKIECVHESGIKIGGRPDRVEQTADGKYILVDYKTGQNLKHEKDDIESCLQVVLYAYILEKNGYKVKECQYRYINLDDLITCRYDDEMRSLLDAKMNDFKEHLSELRFEPAGSEDDCKYCGFKGICRSDIGGDE